MRSLSESLQDLLAKLFALVFLVVSLPILGLTALFIRRHSSGPIIFAQERVGQGGAPFRMLKLRTMSADAEALLRKEMLENSAVREEWNRYGSLKHDPRIAGAWAKFARVYSIDEIPQFINVLRGEMALVGPRPLTKASVILLPERDRQLRSSVRPGLTGLWQVRRRSEVDLRGMQKYDRFYVLKRSFRLTMCILLSTPIAMLSRKGAR